MIQKAFKYRIYPTQQQKIVINKHFGCKRYIYNFGLSLINKYYKETGKHLSWTQVANEIPKLKKQNETQWLKEVNSQSLQHAIKNLDSAFTRFFKKQSKFPVFKSKKHKQSFCVPQHFKIDIENSILTIPKVEGNIKTIFHRKLEGKICFLTISKNKSEQYFVSITVEINKNNKEKQKPKKENAIGIDLGIKTFVTLSNGEKINNETVSKNIENKIIRLQKQASRKQIGSSNRKKINLKIAKLYQRIVNKNNDFLHKLSSRLARENQTICIEDLNIQGMMKNHKLAKSIQKCSWYEFTRQLEYKTEWYGVNLIKINTFSPSSKMCSNCGWINNNLSLEDREWECENCKQIHDRDINASKNILDFGFHPKNNIGQEMPRKLMEKGSLLNMNNIKQNFSMK